MLTWVELDALALRWNLRQFRRRLGAGVALGAVVKSNAYGHGMTEVAALAEKHGVDWLCVNNVEEAVALRETGHHGPVLVMGYVPLEALDRIVEHDLRPVVYNESTLERLEQLSTEREREVAVHLKVETGANRQGIPPDRVVDLARRVQGTERLRLEGIATHFANIEDTTDHAFAQAQFARFGKIFDALRAASIEVPVRHAACSAAAILFTRTHLDMARIGISLYGLWPSRETYVSCLRREKPELDLRPVMTWKTRVAQIKEIAEGDYVGYGCTYRATRPSRVAVLPVGYHEGFDRGLSNVAHVLLHGRRAPVRGRVCMNMCMVDVTDIPGARLEDEVVLLGAQGDERISAEQLASWCGTIAYEIVARVHPGLPRVVIEE